jgi:hypothetical protein
MFQGWYKSNALCDMLFFLAYKEHHLSSDYVKISSEHEKLFFFSSARHMPKTLEAVSDNMNTFLWLIFM